ncbi:MAG: hypothetical protein WA931_10390 [Rhodococcus sp. (in: high G+C Gram-positive bacteria)]
MATTRTGLTTAAVVLAAGLGLTACAGGTPDTTPTTTATVVTPSPTPGPVVTDEQAAALCTDLEAQLSNWRVQGATVGRGGLNILVQTWAARYGLNGVVISNRSIVDTATTDSCSDIRDQVVRILDIPDLASGLVGL